MRGAWCVSSKTRSLFTAYYPPPMQQETTQSELFDIKAHQEEEAAARGAAMDVLEREAEAAQQRAEMLRKEVRV